MKRILILSIIFMGCKNDLNYDSNYTKPNAEVIAYYSGDDNLINEYNLSGVSQLIYSFLHLKGNNLAIDNEKDSITLMNLTRLKEKYPELKVLISLGGWGGCKTCSDVFSTENGRKDFANSTAEIIKSYNADGIDLDWEYPAISGFPNHTFKSQDKDNFTILIQELRNVMNSDDILSFAAGGFPKYLEQSIDWQKVMPLVDHVNIMSYDLYSTVKTGHHTPLYSNDSESYSADSSVKYLLSIGVPSNQIVIGGGFYGRIWENVPDINNGLFQAGNFKTTISHRYINNLEDGYEFYWDETANATYGYNKGSGNFISIDNAKSVLKKTEYVLDNNLKGIMFWELVNDDPKNSLLKIIVDTVLGK